MVKLVFAIVLIIVFFQITCDNRTETERHASRVEELQKQLDYYKSIDCNSAQEYSVQDCIDNTNITIEDFTKRINDYKVADAKADKERLESPIKSKMSDIIVNIAIGTCMYAFGPAILIGFVIALLRGK